MKNIKLKKGYGKMNTSKIATLVDRLAKVQGLVHKSATGIPQVGDYLVSQTMYGGIFNYFYQIIGMEKGMLVLQEVGKTREMDMNSFTQEGTEVPNPSKKFSKPFNARWKSTGVKVPAGGHAKLWDGKPVHFQS